MAQTTLHGSAQPSLIASCGHEETQVLQHRGPSWRGPAGLLQKRWAVIPRGWMDPHPKVSSEAETKDATAASEVGEFSFLTCPGFIPRRTRFSEQNRAGSLAGRNTAQSQEGADWGLLQVRVGWGRSCLCVDRGLHDFHLLPAGREPLLAQTWGLQGRVGVDTSRNQSPGTVAWPCRI